MIVVVDTLTTQGRVAAMMVVYVGLRVCHVSGLYKCTGTTITTTHVG